MFAVQMFAHLVGENLVQDLQLIYITYILKIYIEFKNNTNS